MSIVDEILNKADIVDIISENIDLTRKGKNYFGICPFHDDTSPSMSVSPEKQIFKCFSCGAAGDSIEFTKRYNNISFNEAISRLCDKLGITYTSNEKKVEKDLYFDIYDNTSKLFEYTLLHTDEGVKYLNYLQDRNYDLDTIHHFNIGLSSNKLPQYLTDNYPKSEINKTLLLSNSNTSIFSNRITFPIKNHEGNIIAFSARVIDNATPKYINSPETMHFKKGGVLYNYSDAYQYIKNAKSVIITEGFFDVMRLYSIGIKNTVATMGTAFGKMQANSIAKIAHKVYLNFDGDLAGIKATFNTYKYFNASAVDVRVIDLGMYDPDEFILKYGKDAYDLKLNSAKTFEEYYIDFILKEYDLKSAGEQIEAVAKCKEFVNTLNNESKQIYGDYVFKLIGINIDLNLVKHQDYAHEHYENRSKNHISISEALINKRIQKDGAIEKLESDFISLMLNSRDAIEIYKSKIKHLNVYSLDLLAMVVSDYYISNSKQEFIDYLVEYGEGYDQFVPVYEHCLNNDIEYSLELLYDLEYRIHIYKYEDKINNLYEIMKSEFDPKVKLQLAAKINELVRKKSEILKEKIVDERN